MWSINSTSVDTKKIESKVLNMYLYAHVHSTTSHNSQTMETTQVYINRWVDK